MHRTPARPGAVEDLHTSCTGHIALQHRPDADRNGATQTGRRQKRRNTDRTQTERHNADRTQTETAQRRPDADGTAQHRPDADGTAQRRPDPDGTAQRRPDADRNGATQTGRRQNSATQTGRRQQRHNLDRTFAGRRDFDPAFAARLPRVYRWRDRIDPAWTDWHFRAAFRPPRTRVALRRENDHDPGTCPGKGAVGCALSS
jgi:hypothetical protein